MQPPLLLGNPKKIRGWLVKGRVTISVYGLGHVGAALAAVWLRAGARVVGVDKSDHLVRAAAAGKSFIEEPGIIPAIRKAVREKRFTATRDGVEASRRSDFKIIAVPAGLSLNSADLSAVEEVAAAIGRGVKKGDLVSLNTTVPPGTTEEFLLPILERESNLSCEKDFGLIYTPERVYEGRVIKDIEENYPAIVSGVGPRSLAAGSGLYSSVCKKGVIRMTSTKAAEAGKLFEGVYRDVNIALANELAKICEGLGINYWEVRKAANSQPYSRLHKPGTGVGGACIPIYPYFLAESAAKTKNSTEMTILARQINSLMPRYCVQQALSLLDKTKASTASSSNRRVAVLGLAFRGGVSDTRLSPSYDVIQELVNAGCEVTVHDPYVRNDDNLPESVTLTDRLDEALRNVDLIIVATDHPQYAKKKISRKRLRSDVAIYDGRGILDGSGFSGMLFGGIGKPTK